MNIQNIFASLNNWKKEIVTFIVAFLCLLLAVTFPTTGDFQLLSRIVFFLVVLPILYIKFILKKNVGDFGLNLSDNRTGFIWAFIMLMASFLITLGLFYFFHLENKYIIPTYVINNFWVFVFYEMVVMNFIIFVFEFFFRGFLQTVLEKKIGIWAPLAQCGIFLGFLFLTQKLAWQYAPLIILSLTGGVVAYKSKSFVYSYLMGLIFTIAVDLYIIGLFK